MRSEYFLLVCAEGVDDEEEDDDAGDDEDADGVVYVNHFLAHVSAPVQGWNMARESN